MPMTSFYLNFKFPYCILFGQNPNDLKLFGCTCYVHIDNYLRNKFEKSIQCRFVVYAYEYKWFRCYDLKSRYIKVLMNVYSRSLILMLKPNVCIYITLWCVSWLFKELWNISPCFLSIYSLTKWNDRMQTLTLLEVPWALSTIVGHLLFCGWNIFNYCSIFNKSYAYVFICFKFQISLLHSIWSKSKIWCLQVIWMYLLCLYRQLFEKQIWEDNSM